MEQITSSSADTSNGSMNDFEYYPPSVYRFFSAGRFLIYIFLAITIWIIIKLVITALGFSIFISILFASILLMVIAVILIYYNLNRVLKASNFLTKLIEIDTWEDIGRLIAKNHRIVQYTKKCKVVDEARSQAVRIIKLSSEHGLHKIDKWTNEDIEKLKKQLDYSPRLPLLIAFSRQNSFTNSQKETLEVYQKIILTGDPDQIKSLLKPLDDLLDEFEKPFDGSWQEIALTLFQAHIALGTKEDVDEAYFLLRGMQYAYITLTPVVQIDLLLKLSFTLMNLSVAPDYLIVLRAGNYLEDAEKIALNSGQIIALYMVYSNFCKYYLWKDAQSATGSAGDDDLIKAVKYGQKAVTLTKRRNFNEYSQDKNPKDEANFLLGIAYLEFSKSQESKTFANLKKAENYLNSSLECSEPESEKYWMKIGYLGIVEIRMSPDGGEVEKEGLKKVVYALKSGTNLQAGSNEFYSFLSLCKETAGIMLNRNRYTFARDLFMWILDITDKDGFREKLDKLRVNRITNEMAETCAYLFCVESKYTKAIEILEKRRTYYFRSKELNEEVIPQTIERCIQHGITPIYLIVSLMGSYVLILRRNTDQKGSLYVIESIPLPGFAMRDIYLPTLLGTSDFLNDFNRKWKMLNSLTPLLQPIADSLFSLKLNRAVFLMAGWIAQFPIGSVPIKINLQTKLFLEIVTCSFIPALCTVNLVNHNFNKKNGNALLVGSSAKDLPLSQYSSKLISNLLKESNLVSNCLTYPKGNISKDDFLLSLAETDVLHFDGHAHFNPKDPLNSWFELGNGESVSAHDLQLIKGLSENNLKLAVLSACDSAKTDTFLFQNEGASLAISILNYIGSASTVGTLWPIREKSALIIIRLFYEKLIECNSLYSSATALKLTQEELHSITVKELIKKIYTWPGMAKKLGEEVMNYLNGELPTAKPLRLINIDQTTAFITVGVPELFE